MNSKDRVIIFIYGILFGFLLKYIYVKYTGDVNEVIRELPHDTENLYVNILLTELKRQLMFWFYVSYGLLILELILRFIFGQ